MTVLDSMCTFYRDNGLDGWASELSGLSISQQPAASGFQVVAVLPPLKLQRQDTALLLEMMMERGDKKNSLSKQSERYYLNNYR